MWIRRARFPSVSYCKSDGLQKPTGIPGKAKIKLNDMRIIAARYGKCSGPYPMFRGQGTVDRCSIGANI